MSGFSELIKKFDKTRDYVRDFFIYGFKVRGDFTRKSSRTYDDEKRRVESWLGDHLRYDSSVRGKQTAISVDSGHSAENPLYQAYYARSFTDNDIRLHFLLLDLLADGSRMTVRMLCDGLEERYGFVFDEQTVRGKVREYTREGIFLTEKEGRVQYVRLSPATVPGLLERWPGLGDALQFFSGCEEFGIVGDMLLRSAGIPCSLFFFKHNYIVHTLEDDLLLTVLAAIAGRQSLQLQTFSSRALARPEDPGHEEVVVPMQILSSVQTGRRYLMAFSQEFDHFSSYRLDFIRNAVPGEEVGDYEEIRSRYLKQKSRSFGVSFSARPGEEVEPLQVLLRIDPETEGYVLDRVRREMRCGTLSKQEEQLYLLTLDLNDPNEAMQWVKTLIGRIVSVEGGTPSLRERFYTDIRRMREVYADDAVQ